MIPIIYEDEHLLIVNKPPQIASHPGGVYEDNSLLDVLKQQGHYQQIHLINRLDFDTSGIIVCAKLTQTAKVLYHKMSERGFNKEYLAIVFGVLTKPITINQPLAEKRGTHIKWKVKISPQGKESITGITPLHTFIKEGKKYTLVLCKPLTGRQHQIRVHLASIKHPIVGDKIYIADRVFKYYTTHEHQLLPEHLTRIKSPRMLLHSFKVSFTFGNEKYAFTAPLPEDFLGFLDEKGKNIIGFIRHNPKNE
ncbi:RluA family pseudouridine synthase [Candidatus Woesearchaeota archaeon]|nr:RluA family pseudouridine synthase [Candidatus Woesearchaeota archaeon]